MFRWEPSWRKHCFSKSMSTTIQRSETNFDLDSQQLSSSLTFRLQLHNQILQDVMTTESWCKHPTFVLQFKVQLPLKQAVIGWHISDTFSFHPDENKERTMHWLKMKCLGVDETIIRMCWSLFAIKRQVGIEANLINKTNFNFRPKTFATSSLKVAELPSKTATL